jgi:hypothetical protein
MPCHDSVIPRTAGSHAGGDSARSEPVGRSGGRYHRVIMMMMFNESEVTYGAHPVTGHRDWQADAQASSHRRPGCHAVTATVTAGPGVTAGPVAAVTLPGSDRPDSDTV